MATVKSNGNRYDKSYAINNTLDYYGSKGKPGTNWTYWTAYGVDNNDIEIAKNQMIDTKVKFKHFKGIHMHQIYVQISRGEINGMGLKPAEVSEHKLVDMIGQYFYSYGLQSVSFVYRNKPGIFIRMIINSTSVRSGKGISDFRGFIKELQENLNYYLQNN